MTHTLFLADPGFSSWSTRVGLLAFRFDLPIDIRWLEIYGTPPLAQQIGHPPARTVPFLLCDDGAEVAESLAIAEELAARFPDQPLWPADPKRRELARSLAAEMHAGFAALRSHCPMCLRTAYAEVEVPEKVAADLARLDVIWSDALARSGGPWLAGDYSIADAFFAPVAARIAGYSLPVGGTARAYVDAHLAEPAFRRWRQLGLERGAALEDSVYRQTWPRIDWPAA